MSPVVPGGSFKRSYDTLTYNDPGFPATVSAFRLDKYEATVGRFRKFKAAWDAGWKPAAGSGKHAHLNGGSGLTDSSGTATYEPGWDATWNTSVQPTDANLNCGTNGWTTTPGAKENWPMTCLNWFESHAFCIWDGGFMPSETEWNYAAAGGNEQRVYPWSVPATSTTINDSYAVYCGANCTNLHEVGMKPLGVGRFGHLDFAGNMHEMVLDWWHDPYKTPCIDCAFFAPSSTGRIGRGGSAGFGAIDVRVSHRWTLNLSTRGGAGVRCARAP